MSVPTSITPFDLARTFTLDRPGKDQPVDRDKLVKMAQEFEGMLLLQMVRQMRQAMLMDEEEDTGLGNATMTDTFDVEFANYLAKQGGIGLSKAIEQQIDKANKGKEAAAALKSVEAEAHQQPQSKPLEAAPKSLSLEPPSPNPLSPGRGAYISSAKPSLDVANGAAVGEGAKGGEVPPSPQPLSPRRGVYISGTTASRDVVTNDLTRAQASEAAAGMAGSVRASEAMPGEVAGEGHVSALDSEIPPFSGEGGQGGEGLTLPLDSSTSSAYGWRSDPFQNRRKFHGGVDLRAAYGTDVPTAAPGKVTFAGERGAYGLMVVVQHPNGIETRYAHLSATAVQPGDSVAAGQTIGRVGSTGRSTGPHLHFEVLLDGKRVNPEQIASARQDVSIAP